MIPIVPFIPIHAGSKKRKRKKRRKPEEKMPFRVVSFTFLFLCLAIALFFAFESGLHTVSPFSMILVFFVILSVFVGITVVAEQTDSYEDTKESGKSDEPYIRESKLREFAYREPRSRESYVRESNIKYPTPLFCQNCGSHQEAEDLFCSTCGRRLDQNY